jgi:DMSO/TMAO reductase YedYZ molybdopterin-dependent catalytic subunit
VVPVCGLAPIKVPKMPKVIPEYMQLDRETGLHVTGTPQEIDFKSYRLQVTGLVEKPLSLQYDELRCLPKVTAAPPLKCSGIFEDWVDTATWSGVTIAEVLKLAHPLPEAQSISMISADGYKVTVDLETAMKSENFLAYELEGQPLPVLHGFPLRSVFPAREGSNWVKWLVEININ